MGKREALTYHDFATIVRLKKCGLMDCLEGFSTKDAVSHSSQVMPKGQHYILVGESSKLVEKILNNQGSKEDLIDAIKYGLCCLDADKYGLDITEAQLEFRFQELYFKYVNGKERMA